VDEVAPQNRTVEEQIVFRPALVDFDYLATLGIPLRAGRGFSADFPADATRAYVINETAADRLGWTPEEAVGQPFKLGPPDTPEGEIVGVVEDFHIASLYSGIEPIVLQLHANSPVGSLPFRLVARLAPEHIREATADLEEEVGRIAPGASFRYVFLNEVFDRMYRSSERLSRILAAFAGLAVFIAYLGLFGLAAHTAERRTKEIGVRRALGATVANIVALLSLDFLRLVLIAFAIAAPMAWFAMRYWLDEFAYRIEIGPGLFLLTGGLVLLIAALAVGYQALRGALADPARSLRYE
jgi:putative ABC transport system permease protein